MKSKISVIVFVLGALALAGCTAEDRRDIGEWEYERYSDSSIRPGDDFYRYTVGKGIASPGADSWTFFSKWNALSDGFVKSISSPTGNIPDKVISRIVALQNALSSDGDNFREAAAAARKRLEKVGKMKSIREFPLAVAGMAQDGYPVLNWKLMPIAGRKCATVYTLLLDPGKDLTKEQLDILGLDYGEYVSKVESAAPVKKLFEEFFFLSGGNVTELDPSVPEQCAAIDRFVASSASHTRATGSAAQRFEAFLGNSNPDFIPADELTMQSFDLMDRLGEEMLESANAFLWCLAVSTEQSLLTDTSKFPLMFYSVLIPGLYCNASHTFCDLYADKAGMAELKKDFERLRAAMRVRLQDSDWMSGTTRRSAIAKLDAMAYSDGILDWSRYEVDMPVSGDFVSAIHEMLSCYMRKIIAAGNDAGNLENIVAAAYMTPLVGNPAYSTNAFYVAYANLMCVLPSITPFVEPGRDFQTFTPIIAHEMCHGFDSEGALYDAGGALDDWWSAEDKLRFKEKQERLISLFNRYPVTGNLFCDGEKTLKENMADLGGVEVAYSAAMKDIYAKYQEPAASEMQRRFFKTYAVLWASYIAESDKENFVKNNDHSLNEFRVNGILNNLDAWYDAFGVTVGEKFYLSPQMRVHFW